MAQFLTDAIGMTFDGLTRRLVGSEVLVATWSRCPLYTPDARVVATAADLERITIMRQAGSYAHVRFYASTTGSTDPIDYRTS